MLQEGISSALRNKDKTIIRRAEYARIIEVLPEVANGVPTIVVRSAYSDAPLHLAAKLPGPCTGTVAFN